MDWRAFVHNHSNNALGTIVCLGKGIFYCCHQQLVHQPRGWALWICKARYITLCLVCVLLLSLFAGETLSDFHLLLIITVIISISIPTQCNWTYSSFSPLHSKIMLPEIVKSPPPSKWGFMACKLFECLHKLKTNLGVGEGERKGTATPVNYGLISFKYCAQLFTLQFNKEYSYYGNYHITCVCDFGDAEHFFFFFYRKTLSSNMAFVPLSLNDF